VLQPARHHLIFYQNASFEQQFIIGNATAGPDLTGATFEAEVLQSPQTGTGIHDCTTPVPVDPIPFVASFNLATRTVTLSLNAATVNQLKPNCSYSRFDQLVVEEQGELDISLLQNFDFSKLPGQYQFNLFWNHGTKDLIIYGAVLVVGG
jgi:hypothetical protein